MNPSAQGWIKKLLQDISENKTFLSYKETDFYDALRGCGFIYGNNLDVVLATVPKNDLTEEELSKTNLTLALLYTHHQSKTEVNFVDSAINFYTAINELKTSFFQELLGGKKSSEQLEKIIHKRTQIDANVLTKKL